ncbi:MAG: amidohydrolase family protein, partial [Acidobacteria bacterium]|nr:amidohydrolase family protein [Acidobacteriota bacterium]
MSNPSRREFIYGLGAFALMPTIRETPQLILYNGNIHTVDAAQPHAQAVAIADGRFLAVGSNDDIRHLATSLTKQVDLGGKTVVPGFIDAHTHPASSGLLHLQQVDCDLRSIAAIQAAIRERAAKTPAGQWVLGFKYDDTKTSDGRPLNREDLDAAAPNHAVHITHRGGHTAFTNSLAMKLAGIRDDVADPAGGHFQRDAGGRLTGNVRERANEVFDRVIPNAATRADHREGVKIISKMMTRTGVTSVHDTLGTTDDLRAYQDTRDAGELGLRVYCFIGYAALDRMIAAGVRTGLGDEWVRVGGVKLICDGSISERTARLSKPYIGRPDDFGILVTPE